MKFSIIIPLYNKALYIRKVLESVLLQTYTDFELIIVDDGSTDGSAEIAEAFLHEAIKLQGDKAKDLKNSVADNQASCLSPFAFRLLKQKNAGVSVARNNAVAQAHGDYIAFLDADDWWEPTYLERMAQLIDSYPDAGLYACNYYYHKNGEDKVRLKGVSSGYINYPKTYFEVFAMPVWTGAAIVPRSVFENVNGFNSQLWMSEDFDLWIRISLKYRVVFLNELLAYYNQDVQLKWRALGKLYPPKVQFAFNADYLIPYQENNIDIKHVVDMVKIMCLRQYYISKKYHELAKSELIKIDLNEYSDKKYASYLWKPLWKLRIITFLENLYKILLNK